MAEHVWSVLCSRAIIDEDSHQVSLIAVIEEVHIRSSEEQIKQTIAEAGKPGTRVAVGSKMEMVSYWVRSDYDKPESGTARIAIQIPNGDFLPWQEFPLDLQAKPGWRMRIQMAGIPIHGAGLYRFHVQQKFAADQWGTVAKVPFTVDYQPIESQPDQSESVEPKDA